MEPNKPTISVVIPTFNRKESLVKTLASLFAQSYQAGNFEIIVVDDGSKDGTEDAVRKITEENPKYRIRFIRQKNQGAAVARNKGANNSNGYIIFFLDSDCIADEECLINLVQEFDYHDNVAVIGCKINGISTGFYAKCHDYAHYHSFSLSKRSERKFLCSSGIGVRKSHFEYLNGFDESYLIAEEEDFGIRMFQMGFKLVYQPKCIVYHHHNRTTLGKVLGHSRRWGQKGGIRIFLKYSKSKFGKYLLGNPYLFAFVSPLLSAMNCSKILFECIRNEGRIVIYIPFIFFIKMYWCLGTYEYLRDNR